jgi:hypothetical protein
MPDAPGSYEKPDPPYCLSGYKYSGKHTCDSYEIDRYVDEINDYVRKLNDYVSEAGDYARAARNFAEEASTYARCEAEDAKSGLE